MRGLISEQINFQSSNSQLSKRELEIEAVRESKDSKSEEGFQIQ